MDSSNVCAMCSQVDVGRCSGVCSEGSEGGSEGGSGDSESASDAAMNNATPEVTCLPTHTRQEAVEGPNGKLCEYYVCTVLQLPIL